MPTAARFRIPRPQTLPARLLTLCHPERRRGTPAPSPSPNCLAPSGEAAPPARVRDICAAHHKRPPAHFFCHPERSLRSRGTSDPVYDVVNEQHRVTKGTSILPPMPCNGLSKGENAKRGVVAASKELSNPQVRGHPIQPRCPNCPFFALRLNAMGRCREAVDQSRNLHTASGGWNPTRNNRLQAGADRNRGTRP